MEKFQNMQYTEDMTVSRFNVSHLISQLKCGKVAGSDNLCDEYFNFCHDKLNVLLLLCFTMYFTHSYLPSSMIEVIIVSIAKNKYFYNFGEALPLYIIYKVYWKFSKCLIDDMTRISKETVHPLKSYKC